VLARLLAENPGHRLVVTGHSLGAGVASLLSLVLDRYAKDGNLRKEWDSREQVDLRQGLKVRGYFFSPPPTIDLEGLPMIQGYTSLVRDSTPTYLNFRIPCFQVLGNDMVPRITIHVSLMICEEFICEKF
jgi:hypothetical protein